MSMGPLTAAQSSDAAEVGDAVMRGVLDAPALRVGLDAARAMSSGDETGS